MRQHLHFRCGWSVGDHLGAFFFLPSSPLLPPSPAFTCTHPLSLSYPTFCSFPTPQTTINLSLPLYTQINQPVVHLCIKFGRCQEQDGVSFTLGYTFFWFLFNGGIFCHSISLFVRGMALTSFLLVGSYMFLWGVMWWLRDFVFKGFWVVCWSCIWGCSTLCLLTFGTDLQHVFFCIFVFWFYHVRGRH